MEQIRTIWQQGIKAGLIGGVVGLLVVLVGMVEAFAQRQIIYNVISMGHTLLLCVFIFAAYLAIKRTTPKSQGVLIHSLFAGLTTAFFLVVLIIIGRDVWTYPLLPMRRMFINASEALFGMLTFGVPGVNGLIYLLGAGALIGFLTGAFSLLPGLVKKLLLWPLIGVISVGVLQGLVEPLIANNFSEFIADRLFGADGLSITGAFVVFILIGLIMAFWTWKGGALKQHWQNIPKKQPLTWQTAARVIWKQQLTYQVIGFIILLAALLVAPWRLGLFLSEVLTIVGIYVLLGLGLNIVVGYAGLLDLGYVAFFAIGSYVAALITSPESFMNLQWSLWTAIPFALFLGILAGVLLGVPVLKMRGDYLAIATMGFGEIIRLLVLSDALRPWLGGSQGIGKIAKAQLFGFSFKGPQEIYYLIVAGCFLVIFISWRLKDSRIGRAWKAMREDEDVAQAMGINLVSNKLLAFGTGAPFSAMAGVIFSSKIGSIYPHSFNVMVSINIVCLIIVGGIGSIPGVIVGAIALVGLPELLREFAEYRFLIYGVVLVVMMLMRPEGLWPEAIRKREMHEGLGNGVSD
jgi:branched-chain amino acid transport system permease protein